MPKPASSTEWPIKFQLPAELIFLENPISNFLEADLPCSNARLSALIFSRGPLPRLFLVQLCASSAPNAFSFQWLAPHGFPNSSDPSLLHTLARVVKDQTGLTLHAVRAMRGWERVKAGHSLYSGGPEWVKVLIHVDVEELEPMNLPRALTDKSAPMNTDDEGLVETVPDYTSILISLDPQKHRQHQWVTKHELSEFLESELPYCSFHFS